ncbi:MAG: hypothetical protein M5U28_50625 [Sandaracinaceae bacterium]|nr:hypothetical protein [Sandaracinaceae bacterium]
MFEEFVEVVAAGPQDLVDESGAFVPGAAGGIFGSDNRGINEGGIEVRQLVDKGLFGGAALYSYALGLTEGDIDPATVEAIGAAWGTNAALDPEMRTDSANYSRAMGYHAPMVESLVAAHAYAADEACVAERDEAIRTFFRTWELSMFARFVYYANVAAVGLAAVGADDDVAGALHELSEGSGSRSASAGSLRRRPDPRRRRPCGHGRADRRDDGRARREPGRSRRLDHGRVRRGPDVARRRGPRGREHRGGGARSRARGRGGVALAHRGLSAPGSGCARGAAPARAYLRLPRGSESS